MNHSPDQQHKSFNPETAAAVLAHYPDLETGPLEFRPLDQGQANETAFLRLGGREFIIKRLPPGTNLARLEFSCAMQAALNSHQFPCPRLFLNRNGQGWTLHEDRYFTLQAFSPGTHLENSRRLNPPEDLSEALGKLVGRLHTLLSETPLKPADPGLDSTAEQIITSLGQSVESLFAGKLWWPSFYWKMRLHPGRTEMDETILRILPLLRRSAGLLERWFPHHREELLAMGPVHGDLNWENILLDGDRPRALIDFDLAHRQPQVLELATAVAILCPLPTPSRTRFLAGYESAGGLVPDPETLEHLQLLKYARSLAWQIPAWYRHHQRHDQIRHWIEFLGNGLFRTWDSLTRQGAEQ